MKIVHISSTQKLDDVIVDELLFEDPIEGVEMLHEIEADLRIYLINVTKEKRSKYPIILLGTAIAIFFILFFFAHPLMMRGSNVPAYLVMSVIFLWIAAMIWAVKEFRKKPE